MFCFCLNSMMWFAIFKYHCAPLASGGVKVFRHILLRSYRAIPVWCDFCWATKCQPTSRFPSHNHLMFSFFVHRSSIKILVVFPGDVMESVFNGKYTVSCTTSFLLSQSSRYNQHDCVVLFVFR